MRAFPILFALIIRAPAIVHAQQPLATVRIPAGQYLPLYAEHRATVNVPAFGLDRYPVTRAEYSKFMAHEKTAAATETAPPG